MIVNDYTNSGIPQLYMRTENGFECIDIIENLGHINSCNNSKLQETSVVYTYCVNKLQVKYYFIIYIFKCHIYEEIKYKYIYGVPKKIV